MKTHAPRTSAWRTGTALLLATCFAAGLQAEDPPAAPPPAEAGAAKPPAPAAEAQPATIPTDLERLAEALPGEHRVLKAGEESFDVFVRTMTGGPPKGAVVLIPGDGGLPPTSEGLGALRTDLPAHGWSTWLISVQRPPRVQAITEAPPAKPDAGTDAKTDTGKATEAGKPASTDTAKPPAPQEADFPEPVAAPGLDAQIAERMQDWITSSLPRIAAAVAEASKDGPVTVVAEGASAPLLTGFVSAGTPGVAAVILIDPVEVQGAEARWPEAFPTPVLEVLDAETRADMGLERRTRANGARLASYRQLTLPGGYLSEEGQPSVLARRIRGWLLTLPKTPPPKAQAPARPGPEALGPNRS